MTATFPPLPLPFSTFIQRLLRIMEPSALANSLQPSRSIACPHHLQITGIGVNDKDLSVMSL